MKELYSENNGWTIGIYDERNYVVFDKRKPLIKKDKKGLADDSEKVTYKFKYFNSIEPCVKEVSRLVSNEGSTDLKSWVKLYRASVERVDLLCR
jgi:hypothetical protein